MSDNSFDDEAFNDLFDEPPVRSYTVEEFVARAKRFHGADDMDNFAKFVLTGVYNGLQHQVDAIKDALQDDHGIQALRDYDSVLGIDANICIRAELTMYPVSKFEDTLRRNIHIKRSFTNQTGDHVDVPVHQIPNLCIAKWGTHNMIRVLLPGLYDADRRSPFINQQNMAIFYEKGLRPAVVELLGDQSAEWPPTYSAEMFRARGKNGKLSFQTKLLPPWVSHSLGDAIRLALSANAVPWGADLVFLHQIRGVKAANGHTPDRDSAKTALEELLVANCFRDDALLTGDWWIDVGLEIASREHQCLAWRTDSHYHIAKSILAINTNNAARITRPGSSKYIRDMTSHLTAVSGCRISPGVRAEGRYEVHYLQLYTTDKSITYRPEGIHFGKFLKGEDILKGKADDYCHDLYELYRQAADKNYGLARVEVRVPIEHATNVILNVNINRLRNSLVSFDPVVWWSLRAYRVLAFKYILQQQVGGTAALRATDNSLLLTAAAPWFLNGIHSVPDNGPSSRDLMGKILPLVNREDASVQILAYPARTRAQIQIPDEEEEGGDDSGDEDNLSVSSGLSDGPIPVHQPARRNNRPETLPHNPYGIVFLRAIRIGNGTVVPRFQDNGTQMISPQTFRYIFGVDRDEVDMDFFKYQLNVPSNPLRVANKTHRTAIRPVDEDEPRALFNLGARGYQLPTPVRDQGSDVEEEEDFGPQVQNEELDIDVRLTDLWRQFLVDLTAKVPNRRENNDSSYCKLTKFQRDSANVATYQNLRLRDYFSDVQFKTVTIKNWELSFDKFWPPKGRRLVGKVQNFLQMRYFVSWGSLTSDLDNVTVDVMRKELRKNFDTLKWIPNVQSERVWYTTADKTFTRLAESDATLAAPRILIRWDVHAIV